MDPFTQEIIQEQGIWTMTNCLPRENAVVDQIVAQVERHGYERSADNARLWTKGHRKIVICLVDDVRSATKDYETDVPYLFDRDTLVITDNYLSCPTQYPVLTLPQSFFGIYWHEPPNAWLPDREFSFSVNRIDPRRFHLMLELGMRAHLSQGYINFNCQQDFFMPARVPPHEDLRANFAAYFEHLSKSDTEKYRPVYNMLLGIMPYRNYDISHEEIHSRSRCNMIVESYGSDTTVAFSEKIFRGLLLPVPWTLYGGHYAVAYLESLGFDCMSDVINHNHYDQLKEIEDKVRIWVWFSLKFARESAATDQQTLMVRCQQAAQHNRQLLRHYQDQWPSDFGHWLHALDQRLVSGM